MYMISKPILRHSFTHSEEEESEAQGAAAFCQRSQPVSGTGGFTLHVLTLCSFCSPTLAIVLYHAGAFKPLPIQIFKTQSPCKDNDEEARKLEEYD